MTALMKANGTATIVNEKRDFVPLVALALPIFSSLISNAFLGAMTASVKEKVVDPLVDDCIAGFKDLAKDRGKNEAYTSAIWRNLKKKTKKLAQILKREKAPIANKIQSIANKVEKAEKENKEKNKKKKKDALPRLHDANDGWGVISKIIAYILGTLGGLIVYVAGSKAFAKKGKGGKKEMKINKLIREIKEHKYDFSGFSLLGNKIKSIFVKTDAPADKVADAVDAVDKLNKAAAVVVKSTKQKEKETKERIERIEKQIKLKAKSIKKIEKLQGESGAIANNQIAEWNSVLSTCFDGLKGAKSLVKESGQQSNYLIKNQSLDKANIAVDNISNSISASSAALLAMKRANILKKNVIASKNKNNKYIILKKTDSRLKRSMKRPGRATSWEIKTALNYPENSSLPSNFVGEVDANGNVTVYDTKKTGPSSRVAYASSADLDLKARENKLAVNTGFRGTPIAKLRNPYSMVPISPAEKSKFSKVVTGIKSIVGVTTAVAATLATLTSLAEGTVYGVDRISSLLKTIFTSGKQAEAVAAGISSAIGR